MGRIDGNEGHSQLDDTGDVGYPPMRGGGLPFKRSSRAFDAEEGDGDYRVDRRFSRLQRRGGRKVPVKGKSVLYFLLFASVLVFLLMQSSMMAGFRPGGVGRSRREGKVFGHSLRFMPGRLLRRFAARQAHEVLKSEHGHGIREPALAFVLGNMKKDATTLMMLTVVRGLKALGYKPTIFAVEHGETYPLWEKIGCELSIVGSEGANGVDWSIFQGVILFSLEAKSAISSLMEEPFCSVTVIWTVSEDTLGKRLLLYAESGWINLINEWRTAFKRANVMVFPDYSLPMLYSTLDTGNFFVISGSPADIWAAERFVESHSKYQVRMNNKFLEDDLIILIVGSSLFYNELPWDFAVVMHTIGPLLMKLMRAEDHQGGAFKLVFLCGGFTNGYNDALQEIASKLGLPNGSVKHYGMDTEVDSVLLMADIVIYGSFQDDQGFPPLLLRAMSFEKPVIAPDLTIVQKYIVDGVQGLIFRARNPDSLVRSVSLLISGMKLSKFAYVIATSGKLLARDMTASECVTGYAKLLENVLPFPSELLLPASTSELKQETWEWYLFSQEVELKENNAEMYKSRIVDVLEWELAGKEHMMNNSTEIGTDSVDRDSLTQMDWVDVRRMDIFEEFERQERDELEDRTERTLGSWEEIYRSARKAEKLKPETNERDEGELERIGQSLCIYEIYIGSGAWPFLHHGSLYRGLSLSTRGRRSRSDDIDAVARLPLLNDSYYRDLLCEIGGMFSIANKVDNVHKPSWIGFQSWHAGGRKVSLSSKAERMLAKVVRGETEEVFYFWVHTGMDPQARGSTTLGFWSLCDMLNAGNCRLLFEKAFKQMYDIPSEIYSLPPMPDDGDYWSSLHSWAMPTPSFLEFVMFSRMFADALDSVNHSRNHNNRCLLGSSKQEEKHCYCRILELLVNVWAYHSARKMVYIDPISGLIKEQHPLAQRNDMWVKYFNSTLLKSMDEDLAEEADDGDHPSERWLWPLTGEVHWQGMFEREREERYRQKMDKKRKTKEKLLERQKYGYKQKTLGG